MARLRDPWRTSLTAPQQPRNPQPKSIARNPYDYAVGAETARFAVGEGVSPILHLTLCHPSDAHYGLAPLDAAAVALDLHNAAGAWNKALLDNAAGPSGALIFSGPGGANLSGDQFDRLKAELADNYEGARNAGRPLLLEGGLT